MREILFRGKRKENGKWTYGFLVPKETNSYADGFLIIDGALNYDELDYYQPSFSTYDVVPETVGQYTGLTDKNGKKIFEGDIIKTKKYGKIIGHSNVNGFDIFVVIYEPAMFRLENTHRAFNLVGKCGKGIDYEVIGNIHDNPELLKDAEQE